MATILKTAMAVTLATACFASGAAAAVEPQTGPVLNLPLESEETHPDWRTKPSGADLAREYPPLAQMLALGGQVRMTCQAEIDGRVDECRIVSEAPAGLGFGAATLRTAAYFTMNPATLDGKPIRSSVTIPLNWQLEPYKEPPQKETSFAAAPSGALEAARKLLAIEGTATLLRSEWRRTLDQQAVAVVANGEARSGQVVLDALRLGLEDAISTEVEIRAHDLAVRMTEAELRAAVAYMGSDSGRAWMKAELSVSQDGQVFRERIAQAARTHLCAQISCDPSAPSPVANATR